LTVGAAILCLLIWLLLLVLPSRVESELECVLWRAREVKRGRNCVWAP